MYWAYFYNEDGKWQIKMPLMDDESALLCVAEFGDAIDRIVVTDSDDDCVISVEQGQIQWPVELAGPLSRFTGLAEVWRPDVAIEGGRKFVREKLDVLESEFQKAVGNKNYRNLKDLEDYKHPVRVLERQVVAGACYFDIDLSEFGFKGVTELVNLYESGATNKLMLRSGIN